MTTSRSHYAFIVGNNAYPGAPLSLCENDAQDMGAALRKAGYAVTVVVNATKRRLQEGFRAFVEEAPDGATVVFHFSGHGCERGGENFLLPIDACINSNAGGCVGGCRWVMKWDAQGGLWCRCGGRGPGPRGRLPVRLPNLKSVAHAQAVLLLWWQTRRSRA
jgi:hypothetical protein